MNPSNHTSGNILSVHAQARMHQRSVKFGDLELVRAFGEQVPDGYLISDKAIEQCKHTLRAQIQQLERLRGLAIIEISQRVITVYRADKKRIKRLRSDLTKASR
jgi:hypothetical protein